MHKLIVTGAFVQKRNPCGCPLTTTIDRDILEMTRAHSPNASINNSTYGPPPLPEYLTRNHNLEVIIGVPTDEQVKAIHDTIRAVNSVSSVPALYDSKLSTQLAQYLFTVQMAVYRNEYPLNVFPGENTYTPPSVPSHIPISLEPVTGAPSDGELEAAHSAVRTLENLANSPFFDSALSVKLSQHVFNVHFARYVHDSNQGHFTRRPSNVPLPPQPNDNEPKAIAPDDLSGETNQQDAIPVNFGSIVSSTSQVLSDPTALSHSSDKLGQICAVQQETNRLLGGNEERLKIIERTLLSTCFIAHRHTKDSYSSLNEKGELPWMYGLPYMSSGNGKTFSQDVSEHQLVAYLKFYTIGGDLIDKDGNLKPGKDADARKQLASYVYHGHSL